MTKLQEVSKPWWKCQPNQGCFDQYQKTYLRLKLSCTLCTVTGVSGRFESVQIWRPDLQKKQEELYQQILLLRLVTKRGHRVIEETGVPLFSRKTNRDALALHSHMDVLQTHLYSACCGASIVIENPFLHNPNWSNRHVFARKCTFKRSRLFFIPLCPLTCPSASKSRMWY